MNSVPKRTIIENVVAWIGSVSSLVVHTIAFIVAFIVGFWGLAAWDSVFLVLTTVVSLEAIYLAIFIQFTVNRQAQSIKEIEEDIEEVQEDVEEISEDIEEMSEDVEELQEDIEEMSEEEKEEEEAEANRKKSQAVLLAQLTTDVQRLLKDLEALKQKP